MSVEQLALLACLSKKQIQQIENGQSSSFYSPTIKLVAAKKVAKLIQLDEKDAFDFGPQAELPLSQESEFTQGESSLAESQPLLDAAKVAEQSGAPRPLSPENAIEVAEPKEKPNEVKKAARKTRKTEAESRAVSQLEAKPILVEAVKPEPSMQAQALGHEQKSAGKKWVWLLPVGALVLALVQFQPLFVSQLDALMGKPKQAEVITLTVTPVDTAPASPPLAEPVSTAPAVTPQASPPVTSSPATTPGPAMVVAANSACPPTDAPIENYKSPAASKPGNMVYVKMPTAQVICVEDGDGKVQSKAMEPGLGHSFYGKPPLKLLTSGLSSAEVFFQGYRVRPSNANSKSIVLVQAD